MFQRQAAANKSVNIELWREAGPRWNVTDGRVEKVDGSTVKVAVNAGLPVVGATYSMTYTVHGDGAVQVDCSYTPGPDKLAMMPRFGTELVVAPGLENLSWYGRGPKETLVDRNFERVGVYLPPQHWWTSSGWSTCDHMRTGTRTKSDG